MWLFVHVSVVCLHRGCFFPLWWALVNGGFLFLWWALVSVEDTN